MSYEKFVMDTDYCGHLHSYLGGVPTDDNQLAFEALSEGGPGQHLFGSAHTLANYETAYWESDLSDSRSYEQWTEAGSEDAATRANRRWKRLLDEYQAPPLDPGIDEALQEFVTRKKTSMPDEWH
jgi:trimethylamine--corrinoid protein Co-methyltransferase